MGLGRVRLRVSALRSCCSRVRVRVRVSVRVRVGVREGEG